MRLMKRVQRDDEVGRNVGPSRRRGKKAFQSNGLADI